MPLDKKKEIELQSGGRGGRKEIVQVLSLCAQCYDELAEIGVPGKKRTGKRTLTSLTKLTTSVLLRKFYP